MKGSAVRIRSSALLKDLQTTTVRRYFAPLRAMLATAFKDGLTMDMDSRSAEVLAVGELRIDVTGRHVTVRGEEVHVSKKEFMLLRTIWGHRAVGSTRTLDSHACRLRHKLEAHGGRYILNLWGVGYRLTDDPVAARECGHRRHAA
jgi:DNA-binding response OmpR family regulator